MSKKENRPQRFYVGIRMEEGVFVTIDWEALGAVATALAALVALLPIS
jgi:hypothetical protein